MAGIGMAPVLPEPRQDSESDAMSTLPDPRGPLTFADSARSSSTSLQPSDHSNEVTSLSNKLIRAINHQTDLDDNLVETRHELDEARQRVKQLEAAAAEHDALVASGELIRRTEVERQKVNLMNSLAYEQKQRGAMEKDKRGMEQELEALTTALFEEANQMVAAARREREAADRRSDQLRAQLNETELLLATHQEQLAQLKIVMHQMSVDREESDLRTASLTAPSTPVLQMLETMHQDDDAQHPPLTTAEMEIYAPAPPTSFTHLLHPILRTDLQAYDDFHAILSLPRRSSPSSRVPSGSFGSLNVTNLTNLATKDHQHAPNRFPSSGSTSSLSNSASYASSPTTPSSTNSSICSRDNPLCAAALKETRFYKRALTEDIEPTLRLDTAPGLSWLVRRTVVNSMTEGSLVIEPMPAAIKYNIFACSLCGESRKGDEYARTHRFRTSENDNAQRYPLCSFCLNRMRASCDFLTFLRMLKDGLWKADDEEAEIQAYEESVRLRERMFWARIGGGVVPTLPRVRDSPRTSAEEAPDFSGKAHQHDGPVHNNQPMLSIPGRSRGRSDPMEGSTATNQDHTKITTDEGAVEVAEKLEKELHGSLKEEPQGLGIENPRVLSKRHAAKDSVTMPGSFE
ncbi:MAG: hypothetical protein LQ345_005706 [Seirophora villosa]|nr:MAG: hypothetical protein LQ345_005706 [Seirophora villosa]